MTEDGKDQRDPNVPGRRDTDTLAAELDAHIAKTEERLSRWLKRGLVAFGIIGITCAVAEAMLVVKPHAVDHSDLVAARLYNDIAFGLEKRSRIDCLKEFPEAGLIP